MNPNTYRFKGKLWRLPESMSAYVIFPGDIKKMFGKGLVYAHFTVDHIEFDGCIMNRGHKHYKKKPTYTISINRKKLLELDKIWGDMVTVTFRECERNEVT